MDTTANTPSVVSGDPVTASGSLPWGFPRLATLSDDPLDSPGPPALPPRDDEGTAALSEGAGVVDGGALVALGVAEVEGAAELVPCAWTVTTRSAVTVLPDRSVAVYVSVYCPGVLVSTVPATVTVAGPHSSVADTPSIGSNPSSSSSVMVSGPGAESCGAVVSPLSSTSSTSVRSLLR